MRIVAFEDDPMIGMLLNMLLGSSQGIELHVASTGREGLEKVDTLGPDLVLMDNELPDGEGSSFVSTLREEKGYRGVIAYLTARANDADWLESHKSDVDAVLRKPIDPKTFLQEILALRP